MSSACRDLNKLHPFVKNVAEAFLAECKKQGLNIGISETYRTVERQDYLYMLGRSLPGKIVTNAMGALMSSYHQWGLAFDIYNNVPGDLYNLSVLNKAGAIGQKMGLEWGGSWRTFVDRPHFQYTFGLSIADLRAGRKPPTAIATDDLVKAVEKLVSKGIIGSPAAWNSVDRIRPGNLMSLVIKTGVEMFNNADYSETINKMIEVGIISSPKIWLEHTYSVENIRSLLIKIASKL